MFRRISKMGLSKFMSAPVLGMDNPLLYKTEAFEILSSKKVMLSSECWTVHHTESVVSVVCSRKKPIYFVASIRSDEEHCDEQMTTTRIEDLCTPLAWNNRQCLEVVFGCPDVDAFGNVVYFWADKTLVYGENLLVEQLETVDLDNRFLAKIATWAGTKPACMAVVERLLMHDIDAARDLSNSISNATDGLNSSSRTSLNSSTLDVSAITETVAKPEVGGAKFSTERGGAKFSTEAAANRTPLSILAKATPSLVEAFLSEEGVVKPSANGEIVSINQFLTSGKSEKGVANSSPTIDPAKGAVNSSTIIDTERGAVYCSTVTDADPSLSLTLDARTSTLEPVSEVEVGVANCSPNVSDKSPLSISSNTRLSAVLPDSGSKEGVVNSSPTVETTRVPIVVTTQSPVRPDSFPPEITSNSTAVGNLAPSKASSKLLAKSLPLAVMDGRRRYSTMTPRRASIMQERRERRRSLSPMVADTPDGAPSALDGVSGWRTSSMQRQQRHRLSCTGATVALATRHRKPPTLLIFTGERPPSKSLIALVERCVPVDSHAVYPLSYQQLVHEPWTEGAVALIIVDTESLDEKAWSKVEAYFNQGGKLLFVCQNKLLASLTDCHSRRKRMGILKLAFSGRNSSLGKDFEVFMKRVSKKLKHAKLMEQFFAKDLVGGYRYAISVIREEGSPLILYMQNGKDLAGALFSDATLENILEEGSLLVYQALERLGIQVVESLERPESLPDFTQGYLLSSVQQPKALDRYREAGAVRGARLAVEFNGAVGSASPHSLPVRLDTAPPPEEFDSDAYYEKLRSFRFGRCVLFVPVVGSTMDVTETLPVRLDAAPPPDEFDPPAYYERLRAFRFGRCVLFVPVVGSTMDVTETLLNSAVKCDDIVVVAQQQVNGKGRGGNRWLSPEGGAMFSFPLRLSTTSRLGRAPGFIHHLMALAAVDGMSKLIANPAFPLRIKWPNDIYVSRTHKIGGVLVNCSIQNGEMRCVLGCGINVANSEPTICVNDMLSNYYNGKPVTVEQVIAATLNRFEELLMVFQVEGPSGVLPLYYKHWLHDREEVTVVEGGDKVVIRGLDQHGYLEVRSRQTGKVFSLHPDGNTFDMMQNLIRPKE